LNTKEQSDPCKARLIAELGYEVRASQNAVDAMDEAACRALGINRTDGRCLDVLEREGPMAAGALARASGLTSAATTLVLDRLERAGYASRVGDRADRRRVLVEATPLAIRRAREIYGPLGEEGTRELEGYTAEELRLLRDFLRRERELNERYAASLREHASTDSSAPSRPRARSEG